MSRTVCGICWCPYDDDTGACGCEPVRATNPRTPEECIDILLRRMTKRELARQIGVHETAISHVRAGRMRITHYERVDRLRELSAHDAARKPLPLAEIERLYITAKTPVAFARAIEAAHNITE